MLNSYFTITVVHNTFNFLDVVNKIAFTSHDIDLHDKVSWVFIHYKITGTRYIRRLFHALCHYLNLSLLISQYILSIIVIVILFIILQINIIELD